jgi:hypothetical protein
MYNYNNNPYLNNIYGGYNQPYTPTPQYNNYQTQQQTQPQQTYIPLTFVNGEVGAKAFIMQPNSTIYMQDSDSDKMFIKKSDAQGKSTMRKFKLVELDENDQIIENKAQKDMSSNFISKEQFNALKQEFDSKLNELADKVDNLTAKEVK